MEIRATLNRFYFELTVSELRKMNNRRDGIMLTQNSMMYLGIIAFRQNCTVSELAELLNISRSAVTLKVNELMKQGMISKTQSTSDKRVFFLKVDEKVARIIADHTQWMYKTVEQIEAEFRPEQIDSFCQILNAFSNAFAKVK